MGLYKDLKIQNNENYMKHINTFLDQIVFSYYALFKESEFANLNQLEYNEFSASIYDIFDKSKNIYDFILRIKNTIQYINVEYSKKCRQKYTNLLKQLSALEKYEKNYVHLE